MKTKIKLRKLDARGFSHDVGIVVFAVIFAIIGVGYLVASHASSCTTPVSPPGPVLYSENAVSSSTATTNCQPVSSPTSSPVSTPPASGEQLSIPPQRRPAQYLHVCTVNTPAAITTYVTQGTPNCLPGGIFQFNYDPSVPGTYYNVPCATTNGNSSASSPLRYAYISSGEVCPAGTVSVSKN